MSGIDEEGIVASLSSASYQERLTALNTLRKGLVSAKNHVSFTNPSALYQALALALADTNMTVKREAITVCGDVLTRVPAAANWVLPNLINNLSDSKVAVHNATADAITMWLKPGTDLERAYELLDKRGLQHSNARTREQVLRYLQSCQSCHNASVSAVVKLLSGVSKRILDSDEGAKAAAKDVLAHLRVQLKRGVFDEAVSQLPSGLKQRLTETIETNSSRENTTMFSNNIVAGRSSIISNMPTAQVVAPTHPTSAMFGVFSKDTIATVGNDSSSLQERLDGLTEMTSVVSDHNNATLVTPHFQKLFEFTTPLLKNPNLRLKLAALTMYEVLVKSVGWQMRSHLDVFFENIIFVLADNKIIVRNNATKLITTLMHILTPTPVLTVLHTHMMNPTWRIREEIVNLTIIALSRFPPDTFNFDLVSDLLVVALNDRKQRVSYIAVEAFAVIASQIGKDPALSLLKGKNVKQSVMNTITERLSDTSSLPSVTEEGILRRESTMTSSTSRPMSGLFARTLSSSAGVNKLPWMTPPPSKPSSSRKQLANHSTDLSFLDEDRAKLSSSQSETSHRVGGYASSSFIHQTIPENEPSSENSKSSSPSLVAGSYAAMFISKLKKKSKTVAPSYASWATQSTKKLKHNGSSIAPNQDDDHSNYTPSSGPSRSIKRKDTRGEQVPFLRDRSLRPGSTKRNKSSSSIHVMNTNGSILDSASSIVANQRMQKKSKSDSNFDTISDASTPPKSVSTKQSQSGQPKASQQETTLTTHSRSKSSIAQSVQEAVRRHHSDARLDKEAAEEEEEPDVIELVSPKQRSRSSVQAVSVAQKLVRTREPSTLSDNKISTPSTTTTMATKVQKSRQTSLIPPDSPPLRHESSSLSNHGNNNVHTRIPSPSPTRRKGRSPSPSVSKGKKSGTVSKSRSSSSSSSSPTEPNSYVSKSSTNPPHPSTSISTSLSSQKGGPRQSLSPHPPNNAKKMANSRRSSRKSPLPLAPSSVDSANDERPIKPMTNALNSADDRPIKPKPVGKVSNSTDERPIKPMANALNSADDRPIKPSSSSGPKNPRGEERPIKPSQVEDDLEERIRRQEELFMQQEQERTKKRASKPSKAKSTSTSRKNSSSTTADAIDALRAESTSPMPSENIQQKKRATPTSSSRNSRVLDSGSENSSVFATPEPPQDPTPHPPEKRESHYQRRRKGRLSDSKSPEPVAKSPTPSPPEAIPSSPPPSTLKPEAVPSTPKSTQSAKVTSTPSRATPRASSKKPPRARTTRPRQQSDAGDKDPNLVDIDQLPPLPSGKPADVWQHALKALERGNVQETWMEKCKGLIVIRQFIRDNVEFVLENLKEISRAIIAEIKNLRSLVSRVAILTAGDLFHFLERDAEKVVEPLTKALIGKSAESSTFIKTECEASLVVMVDSVSPFKAVGTLLQLADDKNKEIRRLIGRLLVLAIRRGGPKTMTHKDSSGVFVKVTKLLHDQDQVTRYHAREITNELLSMDGYEKAASKLLEGRALNDFLDACKSIEKKGVGEVPMSSKTMRGTRAPPKSSTKKRSSGSRLGSTTMEHRQPSFDDNLTVNSSTPSTPAKPRTASSRQAPPSSKRGLSARQRSNLHSASPFKTSNGDDMLKVIGEELSSKDWKAREKAIGKLHGLVMQSSEKFVGSVNNVFFEFASRLQDSNSKVNVVALQSLSEMLPLLGDELEQVLTDLLGSLSSGLASKNSTIKRLAQECFAICTDVISPHVLLQPFMNVLMNANTVIKTAMFLYLEELVVPAYDSNPKIVKKYIVSGLAKVFKQDTKAQPKTAGVWKKLQEVMGEELFQSKALQGDLKQAISAMI